MANFTVAFVGLPSSGKSSIINSLVFKRLLQSGVCRTTTEANILDIEVIDDNNNNFRVIDLPGICDSEESEHDNKFNDLTYGHITNANLIIWVSDINKAFITTHEVTEYNKLKKYIKDFENQTGALYHIAILLSKCDKELKNSNTKQKIPSTSTDEIDDSDEDTDIFDLIDKVKYKFPDDDIMLFNAYGRAYHHKKSSVSLKNFIKKMIGLPQNYNIEFNITKYISNYKDDQQKLYYSKFINSFADFIINKIKIDDLIIFWNNISKIEQITHLLSICSTKDIEYKYFHYALLIIAKLGVCLRILTWEENQIVNSFFIKYYMNMLEDYEYLKKINNYVIDYTHNDVFNQIYDYFIVLDSNIQKVIYKNLFLKENINIELTIKLLQYFQLKGIDYKTYDYKSLFNHCIRENISWRDRYSKIMYALIPITIYTCNYENRVKPCIITYIYETFYNYLLKLSKDDNYILLNKIHILNNIIKKDVIVNKCHFYDTINNDIDLVINEHRIIINKKRLIYNTKITNIITTICQKIYSDMMIEFYENFSEFIPINQYELYYKSESKSESEIESEIVSEPE